MGDLRTFLRALPLLAATLILVAGPLPSAAGTGPEPQLFAHCAGRLSALTEFLWLTDGPASEAVARERDAMAALAEAAAGPGEAGQLLNWRVAAKAAFRGLLSQARFATDPARRARAGHRAEALVAECRGLMLG